MSLGPPLDCSRFPSFPSFPSSGDSGNAVSRHYLAVSLSISRRIFETLHASIATLNFHSIGLGSIAILQFPRTNFTLASAQWKERFNILGEDFNTRHRYLLSGCVNVEYRTLRWRLWTSMRFNSAAILHGCISLLFRQTKRKSILVSGGKALNTIGRIVTLFRYVSCKISHASLATLNFDGFNSVLRCISFHGWISLLSVSASKRFVNILRKNLDTIRGLVTLFRYVNYKILHPSMATSILHGFQIIGELYSTKPYLLVFYRNSRRLDMVKYWYTFLLGQCVVEFGDGDSWICYPWKQLMRRKYSHL